MHLGPQRNAGAVPVCVGMMVIEIACRLYKEVGKEHPPRKETFSYLPPRRFEVDSESLKPPDMGSRQGQILREK